MAGVVLPWEDPGAPDYVRERRPKMEIPAPSGVREDLPRRRPNDELPPVLAARNMGVVIMTHRGYANGRLSVCLSSIPANYPVTVCSDAVAPIDVEGDRAVALAHGAAFHHATPWAGRAGNARACMASTDWPLTLFLCDDVWLFGETCSDVLRWAHMMLAAGIPLATLGIANRETYRPEDHQAMGYDSWAEVLKDPYRAEKLGVVPGRVKTPGLFTNPFGACMLINRAAYDDLGGFTPLYWAHDDVWNHQVWTSGRWVNAAYPGRGCLHLGAQSWHEGETEEFVGTFIAATGMTADESGRLQRAAKEEWAKKLAGAFEALGGQAAV